MGPAKDRWKGNGSRRLTLASRAIPDPFFDPARGTTVGGAYPFRVYGFAGHTRRALHHAWRPSQKILNGGSSSSSNLPPSAKVPGRMNAWAAAV